MRRFSLLMPVVLVAVFAMLWITCKRPSDGRLQRELAGTWVSSWSNMGRSLTATNVIAPGGRYVSEISGFLNGKTIRNEGTLRVRHGVVFITVTNENGTIERTPATGEWGILELNRHELILSRNGLVEPTFQRVGG